MPERIRTPKPGTILAFIQSLYRGEGAAGPDFESLEAKNAFLNSLMSLFSSQNPREQDAKATPALRLACLVVMELIKSKESSRLDVDAFAKLYSRLTAIVAAAEAREASPGQRTFGDMFEEPEPGEQNVPRVYSAFELLFSNCSRCPVEVFEEDIIRDIAAGSMNRAFRDNYAMLMQFVISWELAHGARAAAFG